MQHQFHPVANIFPLMLESELAELAADIKANGLREEIWLDPDGRIIDGRNRYVACQRASVEPRFRTYEGDDPITFAVSMNLKRRHLTESQLGMIGAEVAKLRVGRPEIGDASPISSTLADAAAMVGVSRDTVKNARKVMQEGTPEEVEAVKAGEVAVGTLAKDIRKGVPPEERGKNKPNGRVHNGPRIATPEGKTPEDVTREAMNMLAGGATLEIAAKAVGVATRSLSMMRDVVMLADRTDLSSREQATVTEALADMNHSGQIHPAHEAVSAIAERVWGGTETRRGVSRDRTEERRMDAFDRAYGVIVHACMGASMIEVPHFSKERAAELAAELQSAIGSVRALRQRILEIHQ